MPSNGNQPIRQHFVPSSYLERFCDSNQQLHHCVLRTKGGQTIQPRWTKGSPDSLGYERNLYTLPDDESDNRYVVERQLADVDDRGITAIRNCLEKRPNKICLRDATPLRVYVAHLATRVPAALKFKLALEPHMNEGTIVGMPNNLGPRGIAKDAQFVADCLSGFTLYPEYFVGGEGTLLATSDRPVSLYALAESDGTQRLQPSPVDSSLPDCWKKDAICILPIASQCALLGVKGPKRKLNEVLKAQLNLHSHERRAGWVNAMTTLHANHVYAIAQAVRFLLPNQPGCSHFVSTENRLVCLEEFVPGEQHFMDANSVRWPQTRSCSQCQ